MQLLISLNSFLKSRQKVLLKRRIRGIKNRPVSRKRLKQERKVMSYTHEMKLVDIRKQLDRTKSQNHHLNQIIEQLFYPEMALTSQEEVEIRAKQMSSYQPTSLQQWQAVMKMDEVTQQINETVLPLELLSIHYKKGQYFNYSHYQLILQRMGYYCAYRETIMKKKMEIWQKTAAKMKQKQKKRTLKCPYLFLLREEIPLHQHWANFVDTLTKKLQQMSQIGQLNKYLPTILDIQRVFYHIPAQLYQLLLSRNADADFGLLTTQNISNLMKLLKFRHRVKFLPDITIASPQQISEAEYNVTNLARKLVNHIFSNPSLYAASDFINIFKVINSRKKRFNILNQKQLKQSQTIIVPLLNELSFENVETFLSVYATINHEPNIQFVQIIKFDLYRKADNCPNPLGLLSLVHRIQGRKLLFKTHQGKRVDVKPFAVQGFQLLIKLGSALSKMLNMVKSYELIALLDAYFDNQIPIQQISLLQILSAQIVKRGHDFNLQQLGKAFFKITLLGHRSKILSKYIFEQFHNRYHEEYRRYKEEGNFLLPSDSPIVEQLPEANINQMHLQECLLMMLWAAMKQLGDNLKKEINLQQVLTLIPVKIDSSQPLAIELALNISYLLRKYSMFPNINFNQVDPLSPVSGRLDQFYRRNFGKDEIELILEEQAKQTSLFVANYNYKDNLFLPERWSMVNTYSLKQYISYCDKTVSQKSYLNPDIILPQLFVTKRFQIINKYREDAKTESSTIVNKSQPKLYQFVV